VGLASGATLGGCATLEAIRSARNSMAPFTLTVNVKLETVIVFVTSACEVNLRLNPKDF
jgi:hypothetical protein